MYTAKKSRKQNLKHASFEPDTLLEEDQINPFIHLRDMSFFMGQALSTSKNLPTQGRSNTIAPRGPKRSEELDVVFHDDESA